MTYDWIELRRCHWLHEAQFLKSVLEGSGIEAVISSEHTLGIQPLCANAFGGARLLVHPADFQRASELLESASEESGNPDGAKA
jgi:hypothetical protein